MPALERKSQEELRLEDYHGKGKGGKVASGGGGGGGGRLIRFQQPKVNEVPPVGIGKLMYDSAANNHTDMLLTLAVWAGNEAVVEWKNGEQGNFTPLHVAIFNGHEQSVAILLSSGADIQAIIREGQSPLHIAAFYGFVPIVQMLIKEVSVRSLARLR